MNPHSDRLLSHPRRYEGHNGPFAPTPPPPPSLRQDHVSSWHRRRNDGTWRRCLLASEGESRHAGHCLKWPTGHEVRTWYHPAARPAQGAISNTQILPEPINDRSQLSWAPRKPDHAHGTDIHSATLVVEVFNDHDWRHGPWLGGSSSSRRSW